MASWLLMSDQKPIFFHQVVQHDKSNPKKFSKNMYNFLKVWQQVKENFFPIYIYDELII